SLPILQSIKIPQHEIQSEAESVKAWYEFQKFLSGGSTLLTPADQEMKIRRSSALKLLPLIESQEELSSYASLI
ncbi:MAG: type IV secretory system conjugative DNA transfer family protein, partial [Nostoc sp.]